MALAANGASGIMRVPKRTTRAIAVATSSSSASAMSSTPATAAAPQIEKPHAIRIESGRLIPSNLAIASVPTSERVTTSTTPTITRHPRERMSPTASWRPRSTIPTRRSFFEENCTPSPHESGIETIFVSTAPSTIARSKGLSAGTARFTATAITATRRHGTSPGRRVRKEEGMAPS